MSTPFEQMRAFLKAETELQHIASEWTPSGSGFGFLARPAAGMTFVELDYDYPSKLGDSPQWVATVWRSACAFEINADHGKHAVVYLEAPAPSGLSDDGFKRLAKFAVGVLRLAAALELVCEPAAE